MCGCVSVCVGSSHGTVSTHAPLLPGPALGLYYGVMYVCHTSLLSFDGAAEACQYIV